MIGNNVEYTLSNYLYVFTHATKNTKESENQSLQLDFIELVRYKF